MKKQLMRSRKQNVLAGVCGGIGEYFNIDATVVRILWIISAMFDGPGLLIYILCALIIPKAPRGSDYDDYYNDESDTDRKERSKSYLGLGLIGIGIFAAVQILIPGLSLKFLWPVAIIMLGVMMINKNSN